MSLRPRYSLLTLLILTALVAGGVKLWYGPHHVVEQTKPSEDAEYTYTHDWQGNRVLQGTKIVRSYGINRELQQATLTFYRHGQRVRFTCRYYTVPLHLQPVYEIDEVSFAIDPLAPLEYQEYAGAIERVKQEFPQPEPGTTYIAMLERS